jgi:hypothetical protein
VAVSSKRQPQSHTLANQGQLAAKTRTVRGAIEEAFLETLKSLSTLVERTTRSGTREGDVLKAMPEMVALAQRANRLATFAYPSERPFSSQSAVRLAALWRETNPPEAEVEKILQMAGRRRRGRPATLRGVGLRALQLRFVDPKRWSWNALPKELCLCGAVQHGFECRENIRREVLLLRKLLKGLGVKLPTRK